MPAMVHGRGVASGFVALAFVAAAATSVFADEYVASEGDPAAWLFDSSKVVKIDLSIPDASRASLAVEPYEYVSATFTLVDGDETFGPWPVKLKLKGRVGSFRDLDGKAAFKLKFGNAAERVAGLKKLTLNNMVQDPSCVRESLAYELFRGMGIPAPRAGYAVVTVDGVDFGLHLNVETFDDVALARWYGAGDTRHLYEGSYGVWTDTLDPFSPHYEVDEGDAADRSDLAALLAAAQTEGDAWRDAVAPLADLDEMVRMWAVEHYVAHWDGYSGWVINNYYLHSTASGVFTIVPWGVDQTFSLSVVDTPFGDPRGGVLFQRCMSDPLVRAGYAEALALVRDKAAELGLAAKAEALFASLADEIDADTRKENDLARAVAAKDESVRFLADRPATLAAWLVAGPFPPGSQTVASGDRRASLAWTPSATIGASLLLGYRVLHRRGGGGWKTTDVLDPSADGMEFGELVNGARYSFRVASLSSKKPPAFGRIVSTVVGAPPAVESLAAARQADPRRIEIAWRPSDSETPLRFDVQFRRSGSPTWRTLRRHAVGETTEAGTRRLFLGRASAAFEYEFRVRQVNRFAAGPWTSAATDAP
jgi:hypothetical protein